MTVWQLVAAERSAVLRGAFDPAAQALVPRDRSRRRLLGKLIEVRTAFLIDPAGAVVAEFGNNDTPFFVTGVLLLQLALPARIAPTAAMPVLERPANALSAAGPPCCVVLTAALVMPVGLYDTIWAICSLAGALPPSSPASRSARAACRSSAGHSGAGWPIGMGRCAPFNSRSSASSA